MLDAVTLDRVRLMRIEPDLQAWQAYAARTGVHPAIRAYLRLRPEDFYIAEETSIVTPRSWCDLSGMLQTLERAGEAAGKLLFEQYLQCEAVCERFSLYYALCANVSRSFQLDRVLFEGDCSAAAHFSAAPFDEALCCAELLSQRLSQLHREADAARSRADRLRYFIDAARREPEANLARSCQTLLERRERALQVRKDVGALPPEEEAQENALHGLIRSAIAAMLGSGDPAAALEDCAREAGAASAALRERYESARRSAQSFAERAFSGSSFQALLCRELIEKEN